MTLEQLLETPEHMESMSDEELKKFFEPCFPMTRPAMVAASKPNGEVKVHAKKYINVETRAQQLLAKLDERLSKIQ